jgi:acyl dehydratase
MATIKVSRETYERLNEMAGELRMRFHRPVSMDEVLDSAMKARSLRPSDFAGTVVMTDREAHEISRELSRFWSRWRSPRDSS